MRKHTPNAAGLHIGRAGVVRLELYPPNGCVWFVDVDAADYDKIRGYRWRIGPRGHVATCVGSARETIYLARLLTNARADERVFHKNGDLLDFTRTNLEKRRIVRKVLPRA